MPYRNEEVADALLFVKAIMDGIGQFRGTQLAREERAKQIGLELRKMAREERHLDLLEDRLEVETEEGKRRLDLLDEQLGLERKRFEAEEKGRLRDFWQESGMRQINPLTGQPEPTHEDEMQALDRDLQTAKIETEKARADLARAQADKARRDATETKEEEKGIAPSVISKFMGEEGRRPTQPEADTLAALEAGLPLPQYEEIPTEDTRSILEKVLPNWLWGKPKPKAYKKVGGETESKSFYGWPDYPTTKAKLDERLKAGQITQEAYDKWLNEAKTYFKVK
ncbi:MAG: hypothetical protein ACFFCW_01775 [Candidatus Hodarchaeota archaeon]